VPQLKSAFISYSDDGSVKAKQVSGYLGPMNVDTCMFERDLKNNGKHPHQRVKNAIKKCDSIIMVLSAKSRESKWVSHELGIASGMNKTIFVIKTAHNLKLPDYLDEFKVIMLDKLEDLDNYFEKKSN